MKKSIVLLFLGFLIFGAVFLYKKQPKYQADPNKIQVVTSFYPLYFFASQIGGIKAQVSNITPAGFEPHDYEPSTQDFARIEKSKLLFLNGGLESWGDRVKGGLAGKNVKVVTAGEGLLTQNLIQQGQTIKDPHIWLDPNLAKQEVEKIANGYVAIDPTNAAFYQNNQKKLDDQINQIDLAYKTGLTNCQKKDIITSHSAFGYLAHAYGFNQVSIAGLSPEAEPSTRDLTALTQFAKQNDINYIFFESLASPKLSQTLAQEVGAQTLVLDPIEGLSEDAVKLGKDYFSIMNDNLSNLKVALKCTV